jgi:hypothetical protein
LTIERRLERPTEAGGGQQPRGNFKTEAVLRSVLRLNLNLLAVCILPGKEEKALTF